MRWSAGDERRLSAELERRRDDGQPHGNLLANRLRSLTTGKSLSAAAVRRAVTVSVCVFVQLAALSSVVCRMHSSQHSAHTLSTLY